MNRILLGVVLLAFSLNTTFAASAIDDKKSYRAILKKHIQKDAPGVAVIVSQNDNVLFKGARGLANIEHNIPLTKNSVFRIGSITKQFTAAAIMLLQEQNKLSVKDDIYRYVPDFPTEGNIVTIEHLLTHTSGIANYTEDFDIMTKDIKISATIDDMLVRFSKQPMPHKPGEAFRYSNTGYSILGKIIEVVSGQSYADYIEEHVFQKLGMKSSRYDDLSIIPNRASGYDITPDGVVNTQYIDMAWPYAAGGLVSTVSDLEIWFKALRSGEFISTESYHRMIEPFELNDGTMSEYGYGLMKAKFNEHDIITHSGGIHGFVTNAYYFPDEDLYIAIFSNSSNGNIEFLINSFASEVLDLLSTASEEEADQFDKNSDQEIVNGFIESFQRRMFSF